VFSERLNSEKVFNNFSLFNQFFNKFLTSFFLGSENHFFIKSKNSQSSKLLYKLCFSNNKTLDSTFGTGIKFCFHTNNTSLTKAFLAINKLKTEVLFLFFLVIFSSFNCHFIILSATSFCIKISIFSGLFSTSYKKCFKIGLVI
jgi:hypothetical protein